MDADDRKLVDALTGAVLRLSQALVTQTAELRKLSDAIGRLVQPTGGPTVEEVATQIAKEYTPQPEGVVED